MDVNMFRPNSSVLSFVKLLLNIKRNLASSVAIPIALSLALAGCLKDGNSSGSSGSSSTNGGGTITTTFTGASSAINLDDTSIQIQWVPVADPAIVLYRIYALNADGTLQAISSVGAKSSLFIHSGLTGGTYYSYVVRAADINGNTDKNMNVVSALTYAGVTSASVLSSTLASLAFPAAPSAVSLNIYCASGGSSNYNLVASVGRSLTSYTLTGLTPNTLYSCKVKAKSQSGEEDNNGLTASFTPTASPGNASFGFSGAATASNINGTTNQITWTLGSGASIVSYRIFQVNVDGTLTSLSTVSAATTSYTHGGLTPSTSYSYIVRAIDSSGNTDGNGNIVTAMTYAGITSASVNSGSTAVLNFPAANQASAIRIYCAVGAGSSNLIASVAGSSTSYTATGLSIGTSYTCKAKAVGATGEDTNTAAVSFSTPDLTFAGVTSATPVSASQIQLAWSGGTGAQIANYRISEVGNDGFTLTTVGTVGSGVRSYTVSGLTAGTFHTYVVQALSNTGISDGNTVKVSAVAYGGITQATVTSATTATVTFPSAIAAQNINIYCKTGATFPASPTASVLGVVSTAYLTGLTTGATYTCKALVVDPNGVEEPNGMTVSFTPPDLTFAGATSVAVLGATQLQINWTLGSGAQITGYRVSSLGADGVTWSTLANLGSSATSLTLNSLTSGQQYTFMVNAVSVSGLVDTNTVHVSGIPYGGVTSATVLSQSSATLNYSAASSASGLHIYCKTGASYPGLPTAIVSASSTSTTLSNLSGGSTYTCKVLAVNIGAVEEANNSTVAFTLPDLTFSGATAANVLSANTLQIVWSAGTGSSISNYKVYEIAADGVTKTALTTLPSSTLSYTISGASQGVHTYLVRALSATGMEDSNTNYVAAFPYAGLSSAVATGLTTATVTFPAVASGATNINIFCKPLGGSYPATPNAQVGIAATSANITGLASGRTYTCYAAPFINNVSYANNTLLSFQTTSNSSTKYNGVILVSAYGAAPTAPSGPTAAQVNLTFKYFGTSASANQSYTVVRVGKGATLDMTTTTACTSGVTSSCKLNCSLTNVPGAQTCTDNDVAASPQQYDYAVTLLSSDGKAEELPTGNDSPYRITVAVPPANMVLVHRDSANYEHCQLMGRTSDPLNHQRCAITGASMLGATAYNSNPGASPLNLSTSYYDFGYNLFVDRWTAACNWDSYGGGAPTGSTSGTVYYDANAGSCYVNQSGTWYSMNSPTLSANSLKLGYTITPSTTSRRPPITVIDQVQSYATCQSIVDPTYGPKRLLRHREFIAAAAWPSLTGEPNAMSDATIAAMEAPAAGNHASGTYACNSDTHNGIANAAFNSTGYELSRNLAAGPDSFTIGSTGTKNCVSRFGLQDHVGNVWQWNSDQMSCNSGTSICTGAKSALDAGNGYSSGFDMNGFLFNGTQGPGGTATMNWSISNGSFSAVNFNYALGLPLVGNDNGNAVSVSTDSAKFHGDYFYLDPGNGNASRGLFAGGYWSDGAYDGRWLSDWRFADARVTVGFRCGLPAE